MNMKYCCVILLVIIIFLTFFNTCNCNKLEKFKNDRLKCKYCDKTFNTKKLRRDHIKSVHPKEYEKMKKNKK